MVKQDVNNMHIDMPREKKDLLCKFRSNLQLCYHGNG